MRSFVRHFWWALAGTFLPWASAFAAEGAEAVEAATSGGSGIASLGAGLAVGIAMGLAVFAAAGAQGKIAAAFMEGASRNPGADKVIRTPLILSLIFVETLVLFTLLIAFTLIGKI